MRSYFCGDSQEPVRELHSGRFVRNSLLVGNRGGSLPESGRLIEQGPDLIDSELIWLSSCRRVSELNRKPAAQPGRDGDRSCGTSLDWSHTARALRVTGRSPAQCTIPDRILARPVSRAHRWYVAVRRRSASFARRKKGRHVRPVYLPRTATAVVVRRDALQVREVGTIS